MEKISWPRQISRKLGFGDLNITVGPKCRQVCEGAIEMGYKLLAINTPVEAINCLPQNITGVTGKKGKKRKLEERTGGILSSTAAQLGHSSKSGDSGVPPFEMPDWANELMKKHEDIRILSRLTIIFSDVNHLQSVISQDNVTSYDIHAIVPTSSDALVASIISTTFTFDIITFDIEGPHWMNRIKLNMQKGKVAADKDVFFELTYGPSFHGDEPCENMIYLGNRLTEDICTRRIKNIIVSSGAASLEDLKSPKDVLGIGYLSGLDETSTRICIRENVQRIVSKSDARRFGKSWVAFIPATESMSVDV